MVRSISLERIAEVTGGKIHGNHYGLTVSRVSTDTRDISGGDIFFALKGPNFDAHEFLDDAMRGGACAAVVARRNPLWRDFRQGNPGFPLVSVRNTERALGDLAGEVRRGLEITAVGITGTTGKTCTKDFLVSILSIDNPVSASRESFNNEIGIPITIFGVREKDRFLIAEMGARRPGDIRNLAEMVLPRVGIITNVGPGHLELFGTQEKVAGTKAELAHCLPEDGHLLLSDGDPWTGTIARQSKASVVRFGGERAGSYHAERVSLGTGGSPVFILRGPGFEVDVKLRAVGRHQVENAVAAAGCAHLLGSSPESLKRGLEKAMLSPWRTECIRSEAGYTIINDAYNANPRSMESALLTLVETAGGNRTVAVLGGMAELGPASDDFHREAGRRAVELDVDLLVTVGRRARMIATGARAAGLPRGSIFRCDAAPEALDLLSCILEPDDVILVKASRVMGLQAISETLAKPAFRGGKLVANV